MAHPLTQHPPSALAFNSAPRPSPLGFGFGVPGSSSGPLGFGQPKSPGFGGSLQSFGFGQNTPSSSFGQSGNNGSPSPSTSRRPSIRTAPYPSPLGPRSTGLANGTPSQSLKRQRKSPSPTPSSSPSPSSSAPSPHFRSSELPLSREKEDLSVGNLALKDGFGRHMSGRKDVKRVKQDPSAKPASASGSADVDVGLLLAALPASAHLPILRNLLQSHPSLNAEVLSRIPRPEHGECSAQLDRLVDKVKKKYGPTGAGLNPDRAWDRALKDVDAFCRTASTYINYLVQPQSSASDYDLQAVQTLLFTLSIHIYTLLRLVPANTDMGHGTVTHSLLELGKSLVNHWSNWLSKVAAEVNQRGGMFPSSTVEVWANNLDTLASSSRPQATFSPFPPNPFQGGSNEPEHHLVNSFRSALVPLRDRFASELGWLIGLRPAFTNQTSFQAPFLSPSYPPASAWPQRAISAGTGEDEEL